MMIESIAKAHVVEAVPLSVPDASYRAFPFTLGQTTTTTTSTTSTTKTKNKINLADYGSFPKDSFDWFDFAAGVLTGGYFPIRDHMVDDCYSSSFHASYLFMDLHRSFMKPPATGGQWFVWAIDPVYTVVIMLKSVNQCLLGLDFKTDLYEYEQANQQAEAEALKEAKAKAAAEQAALDARIAEIMEEEKALEEDETAVDDEEFTDLFALMQAPEDDEADGEEEEEEEEEEKPEWIYPEGALKFFDERDLKANYGIGMAGVLIFFQAFEALWSAYKAWDTFTSSYYFFDLGSSLGRSVANVVAIVDWGLNFKKIIATRRVRNAIFQNALDIEAQPVEEEEEEEELQPEDDIFEEDQI